MKNIIKYIAAGALLAGTVSCNLDLMPKGSISYNPGDQLITNESDLEGFEANVMYCFRACEYGTFDMMPDVMVNYFNAARDYGNNMGPEHRGDDAFGPSSEFVELNWANPYISIKNFNIFIEGARTVPEELKSAADVARGEAFLARAFAYLHLARHFGKVYNPATADQDLCVPIVTEYDQNARPARSTVAEVYDQIKADLDSAAFLLAGVPGEVRAQRPTIDAVNFMYARYYLDTQDYGQAASYAQRVIDSDAGYSLSSTASQMANEWSADNGNEPVLQFYASASEGVGGHAVYTNMSNDPDRGLYYHAQYIPSQTLLNAYDANDLRLAQWFDSGDYPSFYEGTWYNEGSSQFSVFTKYRGNADLNPSSEVPNSGHAIKPFLISEMYLIAAEANFEAGNTAAATTALQTLQRARRATATPATEEYIHNEWYREVVGEGLYFSCLKRWGEGFSGRPAQSGAANAVATGANFSDKVMAADDVHFNWPIPTHEMQTNLNLVQNEGYGVTVVE